MANRISVASTLDVDPDDRISYWEQYNAQELVGLRCSTYHDAGLEASELNLDLGALRIAEIQGNPHVIDRSREHVRDAPHGSVFLTHLVSGTAFFVHADGCLRLGAGDTILYDTSRPYLFGFDSAMRQLLLDIPKETLSSREGLDRLVPALAQPTLVGAGGRRATALVGLMQAALAGRDGSEDSDRPVADDLLGAAQALWSPRVASGADLRRAAVAEIRARLADPDLSAERVAAVVGVSDRHLNRLFVADEGLTVTRFVQRERLYAAHRDLADPACAGIRVADIAARWGFSSQAHLARAFGREFGCRPSEVRPG